MTRFFPSGILAAFALLAAVAAPGAELPGGGLSQEYFIRQQADEDILIRIDGREAAFDSAVYTIEGELLVVSGVPGSRLAPLFQYVQAAGENRQLDIRLTAPLVTDRSRFDLGLSRIDVRDDRSARLAQAYRWLSFGLEVPGADTAANWSIKVNALVNASRTFEGFGMEELQLWADWFAAQLTLLELGDNHTALEATEALLASAGARRHAMLRLAALRLRADALAALRGTGELPVRPGDEDPVQAAALAAADLASSLDQPFERAEALALAGIDLANRQRYGQALQRFQSALDQAEAIGADDLSTRIREQLVDIHGRQGDVAATSEVLQAIESQLTEDGANDELAQNLLAQGRLLNQTYRHREAQRALRQALEFEHNSATRLQVNLELAAAAWSLGELDEARDQARAAVVNPDTGEFRRPTPVLDVARGMGILAGVARARGEGEVMRATREAQRRALANAGERVPWAWERAQDELADGPRAAAAPWLREVRDGARSPALAPYAHLARLWLCRLGQDCPAGSAEASYRALAGSGLPRHAVAAGWLYGAVQAAAGRPGPAADTLEATVREITYLRHDLPGVLGDWYWRREHQLSADLMEALRLAGTPRRQLLNLARLRWMRAAGEPSGSPFGASGTSLDPDRFRALLARRETPGPGDDVTALGSTIERQLDAGRSAFRQSAGFLSSEGLARWLDALDPGESVLDYDLYGAAAVALVGNRSGVTAVPLGAGDRFEGWVEVFSEASPPDAGTFAAWARRWSPRLVDPLRGRLGSRVYLAAGDALGRVPFEALADDMSFVRLASFPAHPGPAARLSGFTPGRVFLAGQPTDYRSDYLDRLSPGIELGAVMDRFVGPGLTVVQGAALLPDEFATPAFREAELVHLAMPAVANLHEPDRSWIELSEERRGEGRVHLAPSDLRDWTLTARLLVMSRSRLTAVSPRGAGRPPLVSRALAAGAGAVLSTAWDGEDADAAEFLGEYYDRLLAGEGLLDALDATRRSGADAPESGRDRARYQLWVD